jgi:hypothetical protein
MDFCIRDDDTSFFTTPEELEQAYGEISQWGPISLAVVPFHRAGTSKAVPEKFRGRWSVHPLHENGALVQYLRAAVSQGRFEIMLHGYHHDEPSGRAEFSDGDELIRKAADGRKYLEDLIGTPVRVFVPPHNSISRAGLRAIVAANLHLGCLAGLRSGWSPLSRATWNAWLKIRKWETSGGLGIPWLVNLGDHIEIAGNPITPLSSLERNRKIFDVALGLGGVFCAATHYWELGAPSRNPGDPTVGQQLRQLIEQARSDERVAWRSLSEIIFAPPLMA